MNEIKFTVIHEPQTNLTSVNEILPSNKNSDVTLELSCDNMKS